MKDLLIILSVLALLFCSAMLVSDGSRCAAFYPGGAGAWLQGSDGCAW